jgi:hypothetical protein
MPTADLPLLPGQRPARATRGPAPSPQASPYASRDATAALLAAGQQARLQRLQAPDMVGTTQAARLAGTTRTSIVAWIGAGRCIGLARAQRGWRLPAWQFQPAVFDAVAPVAQALGTRDGWALLQFMETPHGGLGGLTPRQALEQGRRERVLAVAASH